MFSVEMIQHLYLQAVAWGSVRNRRCRELAILNSHDGSGDVSRGAYAMLAVSEAASTRSVKICVCPLLDGANLVPASV